MAHTVDIPLSSRLDMLWSVKAIAIITPTFYIDHWAASIDCTNLIVYIIAEEIALESLKDTEVCHVALHGAVPLKVCL